jgi:hypothetical protein
MDELAKYIELCAAQQRSIDNYARVINALKDDFDKLQGAVLAEREACAAVVEGRLSLGLNFEGCAKAIRARGNA